MSLKNTSIIKRKNGTSFTLHHKVGKDGKKHLDLKREWAIGEDRVMRFFDWLLKR